MVNARELRSIDRLPATSAASTYWLGVVLTTDAGASNLDTEWATGGPIVHADLHASQRGTMSRAAWAHVQREVISYRLSMGRPCPAHDEPTLTAVQAPAAPVEHRIE